jgi:hypothetical protein
MHRLDLGMENDFRKAANRSEKVGVLTIPISGKIDGMSMGGESTSF